MHDDDTAHLVEELAKPVPTIDLTTIPPDRLLAALREIAGVNRREIIGGGSAVLVQYHGMSLRQIAKTIGVDDETHRRWTLPYLQEGA